MSELGYTTLWYVEGRVMSDLNVVVLREVFCSAFFHNKLSVTAKHRLDTTLVKWSEQSHSLVFSAWGVGWLCQFEYQPQVSA